MSRVRAPWVKTVGILRTSQGYRGSKVVQEEDLTRWSLDPYVGLGSAPPGQWLRNMQGHVLFGTPPS